MTDTMQPGAKDAHSRSITPKKVLFITLIVVAIFDAAFAGMLLYRKFSQSKDAPPKYINKTFLTQVEVLNACGKNGITDAVVNLLRKKEVDVVQSDNYISFNLDESLVICRNNDMEKALKIAYMLGLPEERVIQLTNKEYFLDATILLGQDFTKIGSNEKGLH